MCEFFFVMKSVLTEKEQSFIGSLGRTLGNTSLASLRSESSEEQMAVLNGLESRN